MCKELLVCWGSTTLCHTCVLQLTSAYLSELYVHTDLYVPDSRNVQDIDSHIYSFQVDIYSLLIMR